MNSCPISRPPGSTTGVLGTRLVWSTFAVRINLSETVSIHKTVSTAYLDPKAANGYKADYKVTTNNVYHHANRQNHHRQVRIQTGPFNQKAVQQAVTTGHPVSEFSVHRFLRTCLGLKLLQPPLQSKLSPEQKRRRLEFVREHSSWTS